jgi:hypothetical protein
MRTTDDELIRTYTTLQFTADRIAASRALRQQCLAVLAISGEDPEGDEAIWRLLQLRKRGKLPIGQSSRN